MQYALSSCRDFSVLEVPHHVGVYLYSLPHYTFSWQLKLLVSRLRPGLKSRGYHAPVCFTCQRSEFPRFSPAPSFSRFPDFKNNDILKEEKATIPSSPQKAHYRDALKTQPAWIAAVASLAIATPAAYSRDRRQHHT